MARARRTLGWGGASILLAGVVWAIYVLLLHLDALDALQQNSAELLGRFIQDAVQRPAPDSG